MGKAADSFHLACAASIAIAVCAPASGAGYYGSGWYGEGEFAVSYDDNVSRTRAGSAREEDFVTQLSTGAGRVAKTARNAQLAAGGSVTWERFGEFHDLDNLEISAEAYYTVQPVPGFYRPWFEISGRAARLQFRDSAIRDGWRVDGGVNAGWRLREGVVVNAGYTYTRRFADESEVFDLDDHALQGDVDWAVTNRLSAYGIYSFHAGEVVSTAVSSPRILAAAEAVRPDDVFEGSAAPSDRRFAHRLDAHTHVLVVGVDYSLTGHAGVDISARWFLTDWGRDAEYEGLLYRASLYLRF